MKKEDYVKISILVVMVLGIILIGNIIGNKRLNAKYYSRTDKNHFAMFIQNDNNDYEEYKSDKWPVGYTLNESISVCTDLNGNKVDTSLSYNNGKVTVVSNRTVFCTLYFDKIKSLYEKLRTNSLVREYRGEGYYHDETDKDTDNPFFTRPIYYWDASNGTEANTINDSWNVVFANSCWQMIRTTETGGVKLLYNGEPDTGEDENGNPTYDCSTNRTNNNAGIGDRASVSFNGSFYYGDSYTYDRSTQTFSLVNVDNSATTMSSSNGSSLEGKYTCKSTSATGTCSTLYYIDEYISGSNAYAISLVNVGYRDNLGLSAFNSSYNSPAHVGYMYGDVYEINTKSAASSTDTLIKSSTVNTSHYYAESYTISDSNYNLISATTAEVVNNNSYNNSYNDLAGMYTCLSTSTSCTTMYYIVKVSNNNVYYVNVSNGNNIPSSQSVYHNISTSNNEIIVKKRALVGEIVEINDEHGTVTSFKLNGETINGSKFTMPNNDIVISDVLVDNSIVPMSDFSAGDLLVTLSGRKYYKTNDSKAYVGYFYDGSYTCLLIVGKTPESVSYTSDRFVFTSDKTIEYNGETYYVSQTEYAMGGNIADTSGNNWIKYLDVSNNTEAALKLLEDKNNAYRRLLSVAPTNYIKVGNSITNNNNGTYTINNSVEVNWVNDYANYSNYYICNDGISTTCTADNLRYISTTSVTGYTYYPLYAYSNTYTYNNGTYTLNLNDSNSIDLTNPLTNYNLIGKAHYTCFNGSGICSEMYYVYYIGNSTLYYIPLTNGKYVSTDESNEEIFKNSNNALYSMFHENKTSSTIKNKIDNWYKTKLLEYTDYIDKQEIYCSDRRTTNNYGSWNLNSDNISTNLNFMQSTENGNINCPRKEDSFNVEETTYGNGDLDYPISLVTANEMYLLEYALPSASYAFFTLSPYNVNSISNVDILGHTSYTTIGSMRIVGNGSGARKMSFNWPGAYCSYGWIGSTDSCPRPYVGSGNSIRPSIALTKDSVEYSQGDGSTTNPYVIQVGYNISIDDNNYKVSKEKALAGDTIKITNNTYIVGSFKLNGETIIGNTFRMPAEDVEITDVKIYKIKNNSNNENVSIVNSAVPGSILVINLLNSNGYVIQSFKLNGETVNGNTFTMPNNDVTISDVVIEDSLVALRNNSNYRIVDYLQFTGTQYIDTGIIPSNHTTEVKFDMDSYSIENLFGTTGNKYYFFMTYSNQWHYGGNNANYYGGAVTAGIHTLIYNDNDNNVILDGSEIGSNISITGSTNLLIGRRSDVNENLNGKIYYFKITDKSTGNLVRYMVPVVQKSTVTAGMYDVINDIFYGNSGTGNFGIPETSISESEANSKLEAFNNNSYFTAKDYLQFTGTQYIDTGIIPSNHTTEVKFDMDSYSIENLFGTTGNKYYFFMTYSNQWHYGGNNANYYGGAVTAGIHTLIYNDNDNNVILDGSEIGSNISITGSTNLIIGKRSDVNENLDGKIYYFKITDKSTGNLVRYFVPAVRNTDSVAGLYDIVNDLFYTNAGTGTFTVPE